MAREIIFLNKSPYISLGRGFIEKHGDIRGNGYEPELTPAGDIIFRLIYKRETIKKE